MRIGKEVLATTSDAYRKLRNTFRYLLGALEGFADGERIAPSEMPELERYMLHLLAELDAEMKSAAEAFEFNRYARALGEFCNNDLSAFFFDIRKDSLYCDAPSDPKRRAYRTVLDMLFEALVRYAAPILCFTAEEVWGARYPDGGSVHLLEWLEVDAGWRDEGLQARWQDLRARRSAVSMAIEPLRRDKTIGSSLEAVPVLEMEAADRDFLAELFISAPPKPGTGEIVIEKSTDPKCGRCWRHLPDVAEDGGLCGRCEGVVGV